MATVYRMQGWRTGTADYETWEASGAPNTTNPSGLPITGIRVVAQWDDGAGGVVGSGSSVVTTANFTQPIQYDTVSIQVDTTAPLEGALSVFITEGGYYQIMALPDATHITARNLGDTGALAPGGVVASGTAVTVSGQPLSPGMATPISGDLVLYWPLDEAAGVTTHVELISGYSALERGGVCGRYESPWLRVIADGLANMLQAAASPGNEIYSTAAAGVQPTTISMSGWFWITDVGTGYGQIMGKQYRASGGFNGWTAPFISIGLAFRAALTDGSCDFNLTIGGSLVSTPVTPLIPLNELVHLAIDYNGTYARLWINGELEWTSAALSTSIDYNAGDPGPYFIMGGSNGNYVQGRFADFRVYNALKSAAFWSTLHTDMRGRLGA